jgi:hypothetical protein
VRVFVAAAMIVLLTVAAQAQGGVAGRGKNVPRQPATKSEDLAKKKADEKAYKDALKQIPETTEKPDPWKTMR